MEEVCQQVLGQAVHSQICHYVLPCLAATTEYQLPLDKVVAVLGVRSSPLLQACPPPALLYSLLTLVRSTAGMITQLTFQPNSLYVYPHKFALLALSNFTKWWYQQL